jgi:hypothetical protein
MKKRLFFGLVILLAFGLLVYNCKNKSKPSPEPQTETVEEAIGKPREYAVYQSNKFGSKLRHWFTYKDHRLFKLKTEGDLQLVYLMENNTVYNVNEKGHKSTVEFIIENDSLAYDVGPDGHKNNLRFIKIGNAIYDTDISGKKGRQVFLLE